MVLPRPATVFQPILDLRTGGVRGYEALSRFGSLPPAEVFAAAHRAGSGIALEVAALRTALARAAGRPDGTYVTVNLSPSALGSPEVLAALPADLTGVVIEITENELATECRELQDALAAARSRGARIAVDDAGAGYAGLSQLMALRPDVVKLDRSLVSDVAGDSVKAALIDSFVRFARHIGAEVCAEGIETMADLETLAHLDVTLGQGYAIAHPAGGFAASAPEAVRTCRAALDAALRASDCDGRAEDGGLERLVGRLSQVRSRTGLDAALAAIGRELGADQVHLCAVEEGSDELVTVSSGCWAGQRWSLEDYPETRRLMEAGEAVQVLASDPDADPAELESLAECGGSSLLALPVRVGGRSTGLLELVALEERPWTRNQIARARIISYALAGVLEEARRTAAVGA